MARRTTRGEVATEVILATFRVNGRLLEAGDRLSAPHGLTSARWQVLGAIALSNHALTVPQVARRMGLARQSVHATVDRLVRDGLVELVPNDDHRRSQLVSLTELGRETYEALDRDQGVWIDDLTSGSARQDLDTAHRVLDELARRLDQRRPGRSVSQRPRAGARR
jgi:DNA-binding MarR family transcriptional regulator